ncbi:MAG: shikimate dehydrogenase [Chitinophagales bacterium]
MSGPGGNTQLVGVIGCPITHSLSPPMHNAAFATASLDWRYLAWEVREANLAEAVRGLIALGVRGFNVTVPHKVAVLPLLDAVTEEARRIGAVNTVWHRDGRWWGENTDAEGFLRALAGAGFSPAGGRAVLLGAGGAARATGYALCRAGVAELHVATRTEGRAAQLAGDLSAGSPVRLTASGLGAAGLRERLAKADLVVNATASALSEGALPVPPAWLVPGALLCELSYGAAAAPVLAAAREKGLRTLGGEEMLIHQGALAFRLWTGVEASLPAMREGLGRAG